MNATGCRPCPATCLRACHLPPCCVVFSAKAAVSGRQAVADTSRLASNSQATTSTSGGSFGSKWGRPVTECALQSVPFKPSKLTVQYMPGTAQSGPCPLQPRRYTLTHNDLTGQLLLTVGHQYNTAQLSGWYNRLLRDEILAYWQCDDTQPVLHIECHVSGEETWLAPPILRDYIFRREMPLVLNVINFAEADLFADNPAMADAKVVVHLASHVKAYNDTVFWGSLSDCTSWQPPPQWSRARSPSTPASVLTPSIGSALLSQPGSTGPSQQSMALAATEDSSHDQPCVLPATDSDSALHATTDGVTSTCQQQAEALISVPLQAQRQSRSKACSSAPASDNSLGSHSKSRQNTASYRLHVAYTAAVKGLPLHPQTPAKGFAQPGVAHHSSTSGLAYHVPPRLGRSHQ